MSEAGSAQEVLVFIPTYNDSESSVAIAREVMAQSPTFRVLVIDDGSDTPLDVSTLPRGCLSVRLPSNFGLGVCTNVAFDHALRHAYKIVVRIDGDGQHPATRIADLVAPIAEGSADPISSTTVPAAFSAEL